MVTKIQKLIKFKVNGKYAHFRKFYTNASSLSYLIPPRTTIMGMISSILEFKRDDYYSKFDNILISVSLAENATIRKQTQSINNLHREYYNLLLKGKGKIQHSQCKMELLMSPIGSNISYIIYVAGETSDKILNDFESRIKEYDFGYGVYFGQRQFKAHIEYLSTYKDNEIQYLDQAEIIHSICNEDNFHDYILEDNIDVISEQMPCHFRRIEKKGKLTREPSSVKKIFFERNGKPIKGKFRNCYKIDDRIISFY